MKTSLPPLEVYYTTADVAKHFGLKESTIQRYIRQGRLGAIDHGDPGHPGPYSIRPQDLEDYERARLRIRRPGGERR